MSVDSIDCIYDAWVVRACSLGELVNGVKMMRNDLDVNHSLGMNQGNKYFGEFYCVRANSNMVELKIRAERTNDDEGQGRIIQRQTNSIAERFSTFDRVSCFDF